MEKIRIAYIIDDLKIGGAERMLMSTVKGLDNEKYNPQVYSLFAGGPIAEEIRELKIPVRVMNLRKLTLPLVVIKLIWSLRKEHVKIVHTFRMLSDIIGTLVAKIAGVPVIISSRASMPYYGRYIYKIMDKLMSKLTTKIIAVSDTVKTSTMTCLSLSPRHIITIHYGIELERFNSKIDLIEKRSQLGLNPNHFIIGTVANLNWRKDLFTLLEAAKSVLAEYPQAKFLLVGDGPQRNELKNFAQRLGILNDVLFLGSRQDVPEILSLLDLFVLSSVTEGFSVAILEAMVLGKPVVATKVGGTPEAVLDEETGILVDPKTPEQLAKAIKRIYQDRNLADRLGKRGKERIEQYFTISQKIKSLENLYQSVPKPPAVIPAPHRSAG